jgi:FlaA1/EpsC-like NDP-sugar epimerase
LIAVDALGRQETHLPLPALKGLTVAVSGSGGYIGSRVMGLLAECGAIPVQCDLPYENVLKKLSLPDADWCLHLAAHKYATTAEDSPALVADVNVRGTANVIERYGSNVVLASTCKAADPMTVYGASKLIAERVALNAGARVVRFVNVLGSTGSVLDLWADVPEYAPVPVAVWCERMWMTEDEAMRLMVAAMGWPSGRYCPDVPEPERMEQFARRALGPDRTLTPIRPRRGDRERERLIAEYETAAPYVPGVLRINHPAD